MQIKAPNFDLVECKIGGAPVGQMQTFTFDSQPQLQSITGSQQVFIKSIQVYTQDMLARSPMTPQNVTLLTADMNLAILNISVAGVFRFNKVPFVELNKFNGTTAPSQFWMFALRNLWQVDWTKTQIQFVLPPTTPVPFSVVLGVTYDGVPDYDEPGAQ